MHLPLLRRNAALWCVSELDSNLECSYILLARFIASVLLFWKSHRGHGCFSYAYCMVEICFNIFMSGISCRKGNPIMPNEHFVPCVTKRGL